MPLNINISILTGGFKKLKDIDKYLEYFVPNQVRRVSTEEHINELTDKLRDFYFDGKPVSNESVQGCIDVSILLFIDVFFSR